MGLTGEDSPVSLTYRISSLTLSPGSDLINIFLQIILFIFNINQILIYKINYVKRRIFNKFLLFTNIFYLTGC